MSSLGLSYLKNIEKTRNEESKKKKIPQVMHVAEDLEEQCKKKL